MTRYIIPLVFWLVVACSIIPPLAAPRKPSETPLRSYYYGYEYTDAKNALPDGGGIRFDSDGWALYVMDPGHLLHVRQTGADYMMIPEPGKRNYRAVQAPQGDFYYDATGLERAGQSYLGLHYADGGTVAAISVRRGARDARAGLPVLIGNRAGFMQVDGGLRVASDYPPDDGYILHDAPAGVALTYSPQTTDTLGVALFHGGWCSVLDCYDMEVFDPVFICEGEPLAAFDAIKRIGVVYWTGGGLVSYNSVDIYGGIWRYQGELDGPHVITTGRPESRVHTDGPYLACVVDGMARLYLCEDTVSWERIGIPDTPATEAYPVQGNLYPGVLMKEPGGIFYLRAPAWEETFVCDGDFDSFEFDGERIGYVEDGLAWVVRAGKSDLSQWGDPEAVAYAESLRGFLLVGTSGEWPYSDSHRFLVTDDALVEVD